MEPRSPICEDEALLLAYAAGALRGEDSGRVQGHITGCPRCEHVVRENRALARIYVLARQESLHPSPEALTQVADSPRAETDLPEVWSHVTGCDECRHIVLVLQKVDSESAPVEASKGKDIRESLSKWWREFRAGVAVWLKGPVPAYLLVLLLLYPAYVGLVGRNDLTEGTEGLASPTLLSPPKALNSEARRGPEKLQIQIDPANGRVVLSFFVPVAPERYRYRVELQREGETLFMNPDAKSFDGFGTFALLLSNSSLRPGDYVLKVEEIDRETGQPGAVLSLPFTLSH